MSEDTDRLKEKMREDMTAEIRADMRETLDENAQGIKADVSEEIQDKVQKDKDEEKKVEQDANVTNRDKDQINQEANQASVTIDQLENDVAEMEDRLEQMETNAQREREELRVFKNYINGTVGINGINVEMNGANPVISRKYIFRQLFDLEVVSDTIIRINSNWGSHGDGLAQDYVYGIDIVAGTGFTLVAPGAPSIDDHFVSDAITSRQYIFIDYASGTPVITMSSAFPSGSLADPVWLLYTIQSDGTTIDLGKSVDCRSTYNRMNFTIP